MMDKAEPVLQIDRLSFSYEEASEDLADWYDEPSPADPVAAATREAALKNISFSAAAGELVLITGGSGCGKSTLLQMINGIASEFSHGRSSGDVLYRGQSIMALPVDQRGTLIGSVFQNPRSQFFNLLVRDELRFGCENLNLPVNVIEKRIFTLVKEFQMEAYLERNLFHLSGGEKQKVACLSVAAMQPPVILYDEPSSNLDRAGMRSLARMMQYFKQAGVIQLVAEHRLAYLSSLVDNVLLMRDGQIEACFSGDQLRGLSDLQLGQMGLRSCRDLSPPPVDHYLAVHSSSRLSNPSTKMAIDPEALYIEALEISYGRASQSLLRITDCNFAPNRIHALLADNGLGKSTFLRSLAGLEKRAKGYVRYKNQRYKLKQMCRLCSVVFQDVNHQLLADSVNNELLLSLDERDRQTGEKQELLLSLAQRLELDAYLEAHPFSLSGGQRQRLAFASALLLDRPILILDEPTSGLDLRHMAVMAEILTEYARNHLVLLATHDHELLQLLDAETHELFDPSRRREQLSPEEHDDFRFQLTDCSV